MKMNPILLTCLAAIAVSGISLRADNAKPAAKKTAQTKPVATSKTVKQVAIIDTTDGKMVVGFWPDVAPKTVANFIKLSKKGFYNGTLFHRIIKGFMIQGGDPLTKNPDAESRWGTGGPGYSVDAEFSNKKHELGVISMARSQDPNSAGSQFFICLGAADSPQMQSLDGKYTAFGKLISGVAVLKKIGATPVTMSSSGETSKPTKKIEVKSIKIVPASSLKSK